MGVKFPFEFGGVNKFGKIFRPVAQVLLKSPRLPIWSQVWMVVDTGADFTILPRYVAKDLGISLETDCVVDTTVGVGGEQKIYLCNLLVMAKLGGNERKIPLAFFDNDEVPPLLGRLGFLETFETTFSKFHFVVFRS